MSKVTSNSQNYELIEVKTGGTHQHAYKPHLHTELSIGIIEKGSTILTINDTDYIFVEGDAVVIMPNVVHNCQPVDIDNWAFTMIYLSDSYKDALVETLSPDFKIGVKKLGNDEYKKIKTLANVIKHSSDQNFQKEVEIVDCLNEIIDSIDHIIMVELDTTIELIRKHIDDNYQSDLSLETLEQKFGVNKFKLIRRFKKLYNITPSAYQLQLKVDYAKQIIKRKLEKNNIKMINDKIELVDVAIEAGFYDQAHFTKEFKKATGFTPKQYIDQKDRGIK